jgi:hypothetical protein
MQARWLLSHGCTDELAQAKRDPGCQQTEEDLPRARFPEGRAGGQAHACADAEQTKHAERQTDEDGGEAIGKDKMGIPG